MRIKPFIILFFLLSNFVLMAQTSDERKKISNNYDKKNIELLKKELSHQYLLRENRINTFLKNNISLKRNTKIGETTYFINDIIDGKPVYLTTHNVNSSKATKTDKLQTGGSLGLDLNGENMIIGVWDQENVLSTHVEFEDDQVSPDTRILYPEFIFPSMPDNFSDHATHVGGTLVAKGTNASVKGMAPKATLKSFDWSLDDQEALNEASNGLLISNHSYGTPIFNNMGTQITNSSAIGSYPTDARTWDQVAYSSPYYLMVASAGNEGDDNYSGGLGNGYDKLTGNKNCKNNLVVAWAKPFVTSGGVLINFPISASSSQGPTDDFRIKPDISGDGEAVLSTTTGSNTEYSTSSGTSMASPNVSGTLLLLQQYYNQLNAKYMKAASLKALVCHTAIDDPIKIGPDPIFGWGLLNAEASANVITDDSNGIAVIQELTLDDSNTYTYQFSANASGPIKATICWTDPAGIAASSPGNVLSPRLVNDLDLRLEDANSTVFTPWKLDNTDVTASAIKGDNNVDNIEVIDISNPIAGNYTLTVSHKNTLTNGSQAFSLIITGTNLVLSNDQISLIDNIVIWPNPIEDKLNIRFNSINDRTNITVYNILGEEIYNESIETPLPKVNYTLNTSKFDKGIYLLNIKNGSLEFNKKIIIK